jgi:hypothetical protein
MTSLALAKHDKNRGVVMVVVLFILAILGVLLLEVSRSGQEELARASLLLERTQARLDVRTHESELLLSLLTNPWIAGSPSAKTVDPYAKVWRFDGEPFVVERATIRIQDVSGQFGMPQPGFNSKWPLLEKLLQNIGIDATRAAATVAYLRDIQAGPDGVPLQDLSELIGRGRLTIDDVDRLRRVATLYPTNTFNPSTASAEVLSVLYGGSRLEGVLALRRGEGLSATSFGKVVEDFDPEFTVFSAGPAFQIAIEVAGTVAGYGSQGIVELDAYGSEPVAWWDRYGLSGTPAKGVPGLQSP